jgi:hypothetical protein
MSTQHTASPWTAAARGYKSQLWSDGQMMTAEVLGPNHAANARLMAAAPDLLAALTYVMPWLEAHIGQGLSAHELDNIRATIAKATGKETSA